MFLGDVITNVQLVIFSLVEAASAFPPSITLVQLHLLLLLLFLYRLSCNSILRLLLLQLLFLKCLSL